MKKSQRNEAKRQLEFRERFRAAREEAQRAAASGLLTREQQQQVSQSVASYGTENDNNCVDVGLRAHNVRGSDAGTVLNEDDTITVMFNPGLKGDKMAVVMAHEGRHVGDAQDWVSDFHCSFCSEDLNHYQREQRGWNVSSYVAQALNLKSYGPSGGGSEYEVWNRGWKTPDRVTTMRARGFANIARYSNLSPTDTDTYSREHQHRPAP